MFQHHVEEGVVSAERSDDASLAIQRDFQPLVLSIETKRKRENEREEQSDKNTERNAMRAFLKEGRYLSLPRIFLPWRKTYHKSLEIGTFLELGCHGVIMI
jgi:hypothetical protein